MNFRSDLARHGKTLAHKGKKWGEGLNLSKTGMASSGSKAVVFLLLPSASEGCTYVPTVLSNLLMASHSLPHK